MPLVVGCYSYTPITPEAAPAGSEVRARITGAASDRVGPLLHSLDTRVLVGNVVENNAGAMVLQVPLGAMPNIAETIVPLQTRIPLAAGRPGEPRAAKARRAAHDDSYQRNRDWSGGGDWGGARAGGGAEPGKGPEEPPPIIRIPIWRFRMP